MGSTKANAESCSRDGIAPCSSPGQGPISWLKSSSVANDLEVLVDQKQSVSQQCFLAARRANCLPHWLSTSVASRLK